MIVLNLVVMWVVWCVSWPKTAVFLVSLLWLVVALFMLLGAGEARRARLQPPVLRCTAMCCIPACSPPSPCPRQPILAAATA